VVGGLPGFKGRDLIELVDYTPEEVLFFIETGLDFKRRF
jgi:hypothetical protein